jgi:cytochrome b
MTEQKVRQLVWDVPTRLFHWLLVALLGFSWWSAKSDHMDWHRYSGIGICGLIIFRVLWGFIGASSARFTHFVKGPQAVWAYVQSSVRSAPVPAQSISPGHNPLGGWSVIALLMVIGAQLLTGLFAVDIDGIESGPLSDFISFDQGRAASGFHKLSFNLLLTLVVVHVAAVLLYLIVKRRNLIVPMITGFHTANEQHVSTAVMLAPRWRLIVAVMVAFVVAYVVARGFRL